MSSGAEAEKSMRLRGTGKARGLLLALSLCPLALSAAIYRWVDSNGVTQYSDAAPQGVSAEVLVVPATAGEERAQPDWRQLDEDFRERHAARQRALDAAMLERRRAAELEAIGGGTGTPVPGETFAEPMFQRRVLAALVAAEHALAPGCADHAVVRTEALGRDAERQSVAERWIIDRCGSEVSYRLEFSPYYPIHYESTDAAPYPAGKRLRGNLVILDERSGFTFVAETPGA